MARDRASLRIDLWADEDWRKLSMGAQHLYMLILSHSTLNYAGVADWRPGRLAALTSGRTPAGVRRDAQELSEASFIYADEMTEEVLIRSFLRHDGVIKHPRLHVSMAKDFAGISSDAIRAFIAFEAQKLHGENPTLALWEDARVQTILKATARDLKAETQAAAKDKPCAMPNPLPKELNSDPKDTSTATATSSNEEKKISTPKRKSSCPDIFPVTDEMASWAKENNINANLKEQTARFLDHHASKGSTFVDWTRAWQNWMRNSKDWAKPVATDNPTVPAQYGWANQ